MTTERDYILGTHDEEVERLGLQHRAWRQYVLDCWQRAGVTVGKRILDVGAGPGYATIDLAEIVGATGEVVALERSHNFVRALEQTVRSRGLTNVKIHELDLMLDQFPEARYDFSWCRWVAAFVSDPAVLMRKLAGVLHPGAVAMFHEYGQYDTWRYYPSLPHHARFRDHVVQTWKESGGEPDSAPIVLSLLKQHGFALRSVRPLIFCIRPADYMWQWPAVFVDVYLPRLQQMGLIDQAFANAFQAELAQAEADANPNVMMVTPLVLEIIAEKL